MNEILWMLRKGRVRRLGVLEGWDAFIRGVWLGKVLVTALVGLSPMKSWGEVRKGWANYSLINFIFRRGCPSLWVKKWKSLVTVPNKFMRWLFLQDYFFYISGLRFLPASYWLYLNYWAIWIFRWLMHRWSIPEILRIIWTTLRAFILLLYTWNGLKEWGIEPALWVLFEFKVSKFLL